MSDRPVIIKAYTEEWSLAFSNIQSILLSKLGSLALHIEHVGSTAVPNLAAKPIIDIDVVIESMDLLPKVIQVLEELGYVYEGNLGVKDREAFARKDNGVPYNDSSSIQYEHHLYVCPKESDELKKHIKFRDILKNNPLIASEYAALKLQLSATFRDDREAYTKGKSAFITKTIRHR